MTGLRDRIAERANNAANEDEQDAKEGESGMGLGGRFIHARIASSRVDYQIRAKILDFNVIVGGPIVRAVSVMFARISFRKQVLANGLHVLCSPSDDRQNMNQRSGHRMPRRLFYSISLTI
jgi:hypothetical protein